MKLLSSKQKQVVPSGRASKGGEKPSLADRYQMIKTGDDEIISALRHSNESEESKKDKLGSAKNTASKDASFLMYQKSPAASDSDHRVASKENARRSRRFD